MPAALKLLAVIYLNYLLGKVMIGLQYIDIRYSIKSALIYYKTVLIFLISYIISLIL